MKKFQLLIVLTITLIVSTFSWSNNGSWELVESENGIDVFARKIEGSKIKQFKAKIKIKTEMEQLIAVLKDPSICESWIPECAYSKLISETNENQFSLYRKINNPWPFKDSDYVLEYKINTNDQNGAVTVTFKDVKNEYTNEDCCKPMPMINGKWEFVHEANGVMDVSFFYHFNPGAGVPAGLVNAAFAEVPIEQLSKLKTLTQ